MTMLRNTQQIGRCGELFVQYQLLLHGIESSQMTTDNGVDLVAYSPALARAVTIQVKTNLQPKPSGGKGALAVDWWLREDSPAEMVALVDLSTERVWMFRHAELEAVAQQRSPRRLLHFYFYIEEGRGTRTVGKRDSDFVHFELENRLAELFGVSIAPEPHHQ